MPKSPACPSNTSQGGIRRLVLVDRCARAPAGLEPLSRHHLHRRGARRQCRLRWRRACSTIRAGPRPSIAGSTSRGRAASITRWCGCSSCPAASACWSAAISRSASGSIDIVLAAGRWSIALVIVLGLAGGFFVTRRVLRRVDAMTETTRTIMAGDLVGPAAGRRHRRRTRPAGGQPQRHARAHRGADARLEGGLRQYRARSQDAADAAAQPRRGGAAHRQEREPNTAPRSKPRSRNPTG